MERILALVSRLIRGEFLKFSLLTGTIIYLTIMIFSGKNYSPFKMIPVGLRLQKSLVDTSFNRIFNNKISKNLAQLQCPGAAVIVMREGQVIFEKQYGIRSVHNGKSIDDTTIFRLGSVSKGFAGILAAILIDKKIIQLDDPVALYVPEITLKAKSKDGIIKLRHILTHSTGLSEHSYSNLVDENHNMQTIIRYLNKLTPRDSTGKVFAYQNAAFGLIEKVIERATGMTYIDALDFYIFSPLNMCSTSCRYEDLCNASNYCTGHKFGGKKHGFVPMKIKPHYYNVASAGGVNTCAKDMIKWMNALMGYRPDVISPNAREIAFAPYINTSNEDRHFNYWPGIVNTHYGLGWRVVNTRNNHIIYHGGLVNGFRAEIAFDKDKNLGVVFMFNSLCGYSSKSVHEFFDLWNSFHQPMDEDYL